MIKSAFVYGKEIESYNFGPSHPFKSERTTFALKALKEMNSFNFLDIEKPVPAEARDLTLFHSGDYVEALLEENSTQLLQYGIGIGDNPFFKGIGKASLLVAGATLTALKLLEDYRIGFAFSGGLHHAHPRHASGFCLINDIAISIKKLIKERDIEPADIFYLDIDAHFGDGVYYGFSNSEKVITLSVHESGRYLFPGTGFINERGKGKGENLKLNIPLPPGAGEKQFITVLSEIVEPLLYASSPKYLILQCGTDAYLKDPLTHLSYSPSCYSEFALFIHRFLKESGKTKLLVTGGGGYIPWFSSLTWALIAYTITTGNRLEKFPEAALNSVPSAPKEFKISSFDSKIEPAFIKEWKSTLSKSRKAVLKTLDTIERLS